MGALCKGGYRVSSLLKWYTKDTPQYRAHQHYYQDKNMKQEQL